MGDTDRIEPVLDEYDVPEAVLQMLEEFPYRDSTVEVYEELSRIHQQGLLLLESDYFIGDNRHALEEKGFRIRR